MKPTFLQGRFRTGIVAASIVVSTAATVLFVPQSASAANVSCTISAPKEVVYGDTGTCVTLLQQRLGGLVPDGHFGPLTYNAVVQFQRANPPLQVDGRAGPKTWAVIKQGLPWYGTAIYAGAGHQAGVNIYACHLGSQSDPYVRYIFVNNTNYHINSLKFRLQSGTYTLGSLNYHGDFKEARFYYNVPTRVYLYSVAVAFYHGNGTGSGGTDSTVNLSLSFYRDYLPLCFG